MNMLSCLLCIGFVLCILFVVSGYKQSSLDNFRPRDIHIYILR